MLLKFINPLLELIILLSSSLLIREGIIKLVLTNMKFIIISLMHLQSLSIKLFQSFLALLQEFFIYDLNLVIVILIFFNQNRGVLFGLVHSMIGFNRFILIRFSLFSQFDISQFLILLERASGRCTIIQLDHFQIWFVKVQLYQINFNRFIQRYFWFSLEYRFYLKYVGDCVE